MNGYFILAIWMAIYAGRGTIGITRNFTMIFICVTFVVLMANETGEVQDIQALMANDTVLSVISTIYGKIVDETGIPAIML